jgi:hypothetical protein
VQVQRLKLDTESAILELDQILKANELSISLVAAVPSLLLLGIILQALWGLVVRRTAPDTGTATAVCRWGTWECHNQASTTDKMESPDPKRWGSCVHAAAVVTRLVWDGEVLVTVACTSSSLYLACLFHTNHAAI